jgi:hypothetical protein
MKRIVLAPLATALFPAACGADASAAPGSAAERSPLWDRFVIMASGVPKPRATYIHYRCQKHFERLTAWLRKKGIKENKPIHVLRKEFGSRMNILNSALPFKVMARGLASSFRTHPFAKA